RADTYNLGDILEGKDDVFALSYIENSLTSNGVLGPLAARSLPDVHRFIRVAQGQDVAQTEYEHSYSRVEIEEATTILQHLFTVQETLLKVNMEYIRSASQDDRFRTEPPFKLQGSYRNMNKLAEKVVPAMNSEELDALIRDHYVGEAQTLTSGAEQNLLKLGELRNTLTEDQNERWSAIKKDFRRVTVSGGTDDDPVTRVTATLGALGDQLDGIKEHLGTGLEASLQKNGSPLTELLPHLDQLQATLQAMHDRPLAVNLTTEAPIKLQELLARQLTSLEQTLAPMVRTSVRNLEEVRSLSQPLAELIELLKYNALNGGAQPFSAEPATTAVTETKKTRPASRAANPDNH
ncbi:MAG: DNA repair protein, partial [Myxococcota bacterium]